jgi:hypothetical protein
MTNLNAMAVQVCQVKNQMVPDEGPKAVPLFLDFTTETQYQFDALQMQQQGYMSMIQTVWVDGIDLTGDVYMLFNGSNQRVRIGMSMQGYINVLCPNPSSIQFIDPSGAGGIGQLRVQLINVPIPGIQW